MTSKKKKECQICGRSVGTYANGMISYHQNHSDWCQGSNELPYSKSKDNIPCEVKRLLRVAEECDRFAALTPLFKSEFEKARSVRASAMRLLDRYLSPLTIEELKDILNRMKNKPPPTTFAVTTPAPIFGGAKYLNREEE